MNRNMIRRLFALAAVALSLTACGVKSELDKPNGRDTPKGQTDPSQPPNPLGG